jgi:hypothetical protein
VKVLTVDEEQKLLTVTLSSPLIGDDTEHRFKDPDNRIMRLMGKPVALNFELVPAAVDAELAEKGYHTKQKKINEGLWDGDHTEAPEDVQADPFVKMGDGLRLIDPIDVYEVVTNDIDPEDITTAEEKTKERYSKYGNAVSPMQVISGAMGFVTGIGGVLGIQYFQSEILTGSSGTPSGPEFPMTLVDVAVSMVVVLL